MKVVAISTKYSHHAEFGGYCQLLNHLVPERIFGIDETNDTSSWIKRKYKWLFEFDAFLFARKNDIDLIHILYGEEYFRFSSYLSTEIPIIATFHQPVELLQREIQAGDINGRVGGLTHKLSLRRFEKLAAAIVLSLPQKKILSSVMPEEKIRLIPHGVDVETLRSKVSLEELKKVRTQILTVGNWLRDWDFYFEFIKYCERARPDWNFVLVNRALEPELKRNVVRHKNLTYSEFINDRDLIGLYANSGVHFLPVLGVAANNAIVESMAIGCPTVMTDIGIDDETYLGNHISFYKQDNNESAARALSNIIDANESDYNILQTTAKNLADQLGWDNIAAQTHQLYDEVVN